MNDKKAHLDYAGLFALASEQEGYFTAAQAQGCGISPRLLTHHTLTGRFIRVARGLYRFRDYPSSPDEEVMVAWLAVDKERGVVSHESALDLLDLTDVIPYSVHLTVTRDRRGLHTPPGVTVHTVTTPLRADEVVTRRGIRLTAPVRTLLDVAEGGIAPEQVERGVREAVRRGLTTPNHLRQEALRHRKRVQRLIATALDEAVVSA